MRWLKPASRESSLGKLDEMSRASVDKLRMRGLKPASRESSRGKRDGMSRALASS
jgi:hypothetical protein